MTRITKYVDALVTKTDTHGDLTAGREPRCCSIPLVHLKSMFEIQIWKLIGAECTRWGGDGPVWLLWAGRDLRLGLFRRREAAACPSPYTQLFYTLYTFLYCCSFMLKYVHLCAGRRSSPLSKRRSCNCMPFAHTVFLYCFHPFYPFTFLFSNMYNCAILGWKSSIWASLEDESLLQWKQVSER